MIVTCARGEMRASADGLFIYDANGKREIALPESAAMPGRSEVLDDMIAAIRTGKQPLQDGRWAKANVEVTLALLQSARERREIMLEHQVAADDGALDGRARILYINHSPMERPAMNYQPSSHDFVVENPERRRSSSIARCSSRRTFSSARSAPSSTAAGSMSATPRRSKIPATSRPARWRAARSSSAATAKAPCAR